MGHYGWKAELRCVGEERLVCPLSSLWCKPQRMAALSPKQTWLSLYFACVNRRTWETWLIVLKLRASLEQAGR